jgi:hypothetical protein
MSRERSIGLVILLLVIFLLVVMFRACRSESEDPSPTTPPAEGVVFAELDRHSL